MAYFGLLHRAPLKRRLLRLILILLLGAYPATLPAQWVKTNGPSGGYIYALSAQGDTLFAGADNGIFRSLDAGISWRPVDSGLVQREILTVTVQGRDLWAGTYGLIYHSDNLGTSWRIEIQGLSDVTNYNAFASLDSLLFVASSGYSDGHVTGGLWRSTDRGESWEQCLYNWCDYYSLISFDTLLFAGGSGGVFSSSDRGMSWHRSDSTMNASVWSFAASPEGSDSLLFAGTSTSDVYRSSDQGRSWQLIGPGKGAFLAASGTILIGAARGGGIFRSTDRGESWQEASGGLTATTITSMVTGGSLEGSDSSRVVYAGTTDGVFRSTDLGLSWEEADSGLTGHRLLSLAARDSLLFAGTTFGPLRSTDQGRSWSKADFTLTPSYRDDGWVKALALSDSTVLAGTTGAMLRSSDLGAHWEVSANYAAWVNAMILTDSTWLVAGRVTSRSRDHGLTWVHTLPEFVQCMVDGGDGRLYLTTAAPTKVYLSTDNGLSWTPRGTGAADPWSLVAKGNELFCGYSDGGVFHSTDQGTSWVSANQGLPPPGGYPWGATTYALIRYRDTFFGGNSEGGVYRWEGDSLGWVSVSDGLTGYGVRALCIDSGLLYAGMLNGSIWYRPLSEITTVKESDRILPMRFSLEQNYPNPFNPPTTIRYSLPHRSHVALTVFNMLGQRVATLASADEDAGIHEVKFDGEGLASGVYFYRLDASGYSQSRKLMLLK